MPISERDQQLPTSGRALIAWPPDAAVDALAAELGIHARGTHVLIPQANNTRPSLSADHGLAGFPWHTDGATQFSPPRWLMMRALEPCETPTLILDGLTVTEDAGLRAAMQGAIWRVAGGRRPFFAPVVGPRDGALRWNPDIMHPMGRHAASIDPKLRATLSAEPGIVHRWKVGEVLLLDNHRWLHARPEVDGRDILNRRLERILGD